MINNQHTNNSYEIRGEIDKLCNLENLKPKYEMKIIHIPNKGKNVFDDDISYGELQFTSLTDFKFFLLSDHYDNIVNKTDDRIIVVNLETDEIIFDTDKDD